MKPAALIFVIIMISSVAYLGCENGEEASVAPPASTPAQQQQQQENKMTYEVQKTPEQWKEILTDQEYRILRKKGTERAFTGKYHDSKEQGTYLCAGCGQKLFASNTKFDSGTGWPSYYQPYEPGSVEEHPDHSLFMKRTEVLCSRCGGHLGHVFTDGPKPTGLRYCINSAALDFEPAEGEKDQ